MTLRPRNMLASSSVALIASVNGMALALGPEHARVWLLVSGLLAIGSALQSIAWEPDDLMAALLFSLPPVIALVADGSPTWLIGPLGALLLVAAELNVLSWDYDGVAPGDDVLRQRLRSIGMLGALGLGLSLIVYAAGGLPAPGSAVVVIIAAGAVVALGRLLFRLQE
jgi:hypothetical protein